MPFGCIKCSCLTNATQIKPLSPLQWIRNYARLLGVDGKNLAGIKALSSALPLLKNYCVPAYLWMNLWPTRLTARRVWIISIPPEFAPPAKWLPTEFADVTCLPPNNARHDFKLICHCQFFLLAHPGSGFSRDFFKPFIHAPRKAKPMPTMKPANFSMKRELANIAIWFVVAMILVGAVETYFQWMARSYEVQLQMILDLQKHNEYLHTVIAGCPHK